MIKETMGEPMSYENQFTMFLQVNHDRGSSLIASETNFESNETKDSYHMGNGSWLYILRPSWSLFLLLSSLFMKCLIWNVYGVGKRAFPI